MVEEPVQVEEEKEGNFFQTFFSVLLTLQENIAMKDICERYYGLFPIYCPSQLSQLRRENFQKKSFKENYKHVYLIHT